MQRSYFIVMLCVTVVDWFVEVIGRRSRCIIRLKSRVMKFFKSWLWGQLPWQLLNETRASFWCMDWLLSKKTIQPWLHFKTEGLGVKRQNRKIKQSNMFKESHPVSWARWAAALKWGLLDSQMSQRWVCNGVAFTRARYGRVRQGECLFFWEHSAAHYIFWTRPTERSLDPLSLQRWSDDSCS